MFSIHLNIIHGPKLLRSDQFHKGFILGNYRGIGMAAIPKTFCCKYYKEVL